MVQIPPLTDIQRTLLNHLLDCEKRGVFPTYREVAEHFGWKAVATARDHLRALSDKGFIAPSEGRSRNLRPTVQAKVLIQSESEPGSPGGPGPNPVEGLAQDLVGLLAPFLKKRRFKQGTILWQGGNPAERCIVIDRGRIMASRRLPSGRSVPTCMRGPGEIVGFPPLFDGSGYPTTVEALEDLEARVLERSDLLKAVQDGPIAILMFKLFANRLREVFKVVDQLSQRGAIPRVASTLLALVKEGPTKAEFTFVTLPLASATLAKALGIAPETLSRAISQLISEGILHRLSVRRYQVLDLDRLKAHAQEPDWA